MNHKNKLQHSLKLQFMADLAAVQLFLLIPQLQLFPSVNTALASSSAILNRSSTLKTKFKNITL